MPTFPKSLNQKLREHRARQKKLAAEHPATVEVQGLLSLGRHITQLPSKLSAIEVDPEDGTSILAFFDGKPIHIRITPLE